MSEETIADILAEMFDFSDKRIEEGRDHAMTSESVGLIVHQLAKRFEAAWKRESVGNAAAMREALVRCREIALQWQADEAAGVAGTTDKPSARSAAEAVIDMEFEINAALSDPARNCDMPYHDRVEMYGAFKDWCKAKGHTMEPMLAYDAFDWLFAPAERKGEGDSSGN